MTTDTKITPLTASQNTTITPGSGEWTYSDEARAATQRIKIDQELLAAVALNVQNAKDALRTATMLAAEIKSPLLKDIAEFQIAKLYT